MSTVSPSQQVRIPGPGLLARAGGQPADQPAVQHRAPRAGGELGRDQRVAVGPKNPQRSPSSP